MSKSRERETTLVYSWHLSKRRPINPQIRPDNLGLESSAEELKFQTKTDLEAGLRNDIRKYIYIIICTFSIFWVLSSRDTCEETGKMVVSPLHSSRAVGIYPNSCNKEFIELRLEKLGVCCHCSIFQNIWGCPTSVWQWRGERTGIEDAGQEVAVVIKPRA